MGRIIGIDKEGIYRIDPRRRPDLMPRSTLIGAPEQSRLPARGIYFISVAGRAERVYNRRINSARRGPGLSAVRRPPDPLQLPGGKHHSGVLRHLHESEHLLEPRAHCLPVFPGVGGPEHVCLRGRVERPPVPRVHEDPLDEPSRDPVHFLFPRRSVVDRLEHAERRRNVDDG